MALIISVPEKADFYVGSQTSLDDMERVVVDRIENETSYILKVKDQVFRVTDEFGVEIFPNVVVSCGRTGTLINAKLAISAPKSVRILRGNLYRRYKRLKEEDADFDVDPTGTGSR